MENPTWKFIFFASILFQVAFSAPPPSPRSDLISEIERSSQSSGNNDDLASLITNFLQGQGSSGSNYHGHSGYQNHPPPGTNPPTEAYGHTETTPDPVEEEIEDEMPDIVTDVTIGCRLSDQMPSSMDAAGNSVCASPTCLMTTGGMCVCPRNQIDCSEAGNSKQCVWLDTTQTDDVLKSGKCIHKTEVLYNVLYKKLKSRGKKSLALSIYYNSKPAQGRAPYGPHGPFIVDAVGHYLQKGRYGGYGGYNSYDSHYGHDSYKQPSYGYDSHYGHDSYKQPSYGYDSHYGHDSYKQPSYGYDSHYGHDSYKPPSYGYDSHHGHDSYKPPSYGYDSHHGYDSYKKPSYGDDSYKKPYDDYEKPHYEEPEPTEEPYEEKYEPDSYSSPHDHYQKPKYGYGQDYPYQPSQDHYGHNHYDKPNYPEYGGGYNHYEKPYGGHGMNPYRGHETYNKPYGHYGKNPYKRDDYKKPKYGYKGKYEGKYEDKHEDDS